MIRGKRWGRLIKLTPSLFVYKSFRNLKGLLVFRVGFL